MRGRRESQETMLALVTLNELVPKRHPIRIVKKLADECLAEMSSTFDEMYAKVGRASIPPERLLKAQLLMALYTVRSERMLCERIQFDMLFRWFLDMSMTEGVFRKDMGLREVWFRDLYRTRSPIAHGALSSKERRRWSTQEHLLLASYVVPSLVLGELSNARQYTLTESDRDAVRAFDGLLSMSDCFEQEEHTMSFLWPQVLIGEE